MSEWVRHFASKGGLDIGVFDEMDFQMLIIASRMHGRCKDQTTG